MRSFKDKLMVLDVFLYFATIAYLYHIHYQVYGSAVETAFHVIVWMPIIGFCIRFFLCKGRVENKNLNNNIQILFWLFFGSGSVIALFWLLKNRYTLSLYYYIGIFIIYLIERIMIKNKQ